MTVLNKQHYIFRAALRRVYQWHPDRKVAREKAKILPYIYMCNLCGQAISEKPVEPSIEDIELFKSHDMNLIHGKTQVDHIEPVDNPLTGFTDWNDYMARLDCGVDGLQVICTDCHYLKTQMEKDLRNEHKRLQKSK